MKRIALAGNPNSGKTTLFNILTGSTAHVGNWPGVTVERKEGTYKKGAEPLQIIDLPGIYSLSPYTPEETITRNYILNDKPEAVINIVDATNLERNLYLTTQLLEMDVPVVVALNMMDVLEKAGDKIDTDKLTKEIGCPVVAISAQKGTGLDLLMEKVYEEAGKPREGKTVLENGPLGHLIRDCKAAFKGINVEHPLFHAVKLVEMDSIEVNDHPDLVNIVEEFKKGYTDDTFGTDTEAMAADQRYKYISDHFSNAKTSKESSEDKEEAKKLTKSDKADRILTNRWLGIPIFLVILFAIFHLTFSTNFLWFGGIFKANEVGPSFEGTIFEGLFWTADGINSPGVILQSFVINVTDWLLDVVNGWLDGAAPWVQGFICDGVLSGVFAVISFIPQILLLFLFFSILEDTGYMARIAFILDRIFRKFGLSGRAFMPMIMGFGCSVPASINTRTLADDNERTATLRVIPFFSCGAKLPILTAVAGGICSLTGLANADLITYSMYIIGVVIAIIAVLLMRHTTMRGEVPPFIMELPAYHVPNGKALMYHLWDKLKHYIKKAFTIILVSTIIIWFLSHFAWNWRFLEDEEMNSSILAGIGQLLQPLFTPLGFGSQLGQTAANSFGWVFVVGAVTGLIAKENVIATFATLAACILSVLPQMGFDIEAINADETGVLAVQAMIAATGITVPALLSFIVFNMTTIPCFAAVATAKAELPEGKFGSTVVFWLATSYLASCIIYTVGSWWWTLFIWAAVAALVIVGITYFNKWRDGKIELFGKPYHKA